MPSPGSTPAGFLLHEQRRRGWPGSAGRRSTRTPTRPLGEIFVIGVDPDFGGAGSGGARRWPASWLAAHGLDIGMLYVDADNAAARRCTSASASSCTTSTGLR